MRKLTQNDIYHISGGSYESEYGFQEKYANLGYEIGRGWAAYQQAVDKYGGDNVPYTLWPPSEQSTQYIIFAIQS